MLECKKAHPEFIERTTVLTKTPNGGTVQVVQEKPGVFCTRLRGHEDRDDAGCAAYTFGIKSGPEFFEPAPRVECGHDDCPPYSCTVESGLPEGDPFEPDEDEVPF